MNKTYKTKSLILPGEHTELNDIIFTAVERKRDIPCIEQCDAVLERNAYCSGFCTRWSNCGDIVFKKMAVVPDNIELVETKFAYEGRKEALKRLKKLQDQKEEAKQKEAAK